MPALKTELITDVARLRPVEDEWRGFAAERSNAFVTPEWFHSWWECQGRDGASPLISVARRADGSIAGVMPLVRDDTSRPRAVRFGGAALGDHFHPAAAVEDEAAVAAATMGALEAVGLDHRMLLLERTDAGARWWRAMREASAVKRMLVEQQHAIMPFVDLRDLDWEGYLARRSKQFRKQVRRAERSLVAEHSMELRAATADTFEADLAELFRLHDLRRDALGGSSLHAPARRSLTAFAAAALDRGWLRLILMEAEGHPIAAFLGWRIGGRFASYQGGFDPAWSKEGVGFATEALVLRSAIEEGAEEYDFLLGAEQWKRRFTDEARSIQTAALPRAGRPLSYLVAGEARLRRYGSNLPESSILRRVGKSLHEKIPRSGHA